MAKINENVNILEALTPHDRKVIESVMETHPDLTAAEAIEMTAEFGGLKDLSSPAARDLLAKSSAT